MRSEMNDTCDVEFRNAQIDIDHSESEISFVAITIVS